MVWRTETFKQLDQPLRRVLGEATAKAFLSLGVVTLGDLLRLLPRHLMSGTDLTDIDTLINRHRGSDDYVALMASVNHLAVHGQSPRQRLEVELSDGRHSLTATFFGRDSLIKYWQKLLSVSSRGIFAGKLGWFRNQAQLAHPAFVMITAEGLVGSAQGTKMARAVQASSFIGLYPQTSKLPTWTVAESIDLGLAQVGEIADPLPEAIRQETGLPSLAQALDWVHHPATRDQFNQGVQRLLFDEAFAAQVTMAYRRAHRSDSQAVARPLRDDGWLARFDAALPFQLTDDQRQVGQLIARELAAATPMQRLLQGEVGSGKTVLALRAMLQVIDQGGQACLVAPTEVLAQQHLRSIKTLLGPLAADGLLNTDGVELVLLTGSSTVRQRGASLEAISSGQAQLIIGTHALFSKSLQFHDLGLVVVDEQHRFGVEQRGSLFKAGPTRPHSLVMTATPIPRSVAMTIFGDSEVSELRQLPAGRAAVTTTIIDQVRQPSWVDRCWARVREEVEQGHQVFIVAPRIDAQTGDDWASIEELSKRLEQPLAGLKLAVLHGRLPSGEKTDIMDRFSRGCLDVLLATSMIEVGVDQANATMMVIVGGERFGLSQLHQLRGRIGRGCLPGVCLVMTTAEPMSPARRRLELLATSRDGFELAAADLEQRREGDVLGTSQAGRGSHLRLLRVLEHADLIEQARRLAELQVVADPEMSDPGVADMVQELESRADDDALAVG
ncbi:MAG: ATP-dependent DNA helicase RecG [Propionibacteriaceae bacterium]|jgi:ATP-dependent DNA helicase RecG|nr:ATP-dependent DNA helicase RecG [Propionibacteriaceae bacterium]